MVPLLKSVGRVTAEAIFARYSVPEVHLAAMDGIAVQSRETRGASEQHPVTLKQAVRVNTGNVVPPLYDAVIMIEDVYIDHERFIIRRAAPPWQHVRPAGEDIGESEMALPSRHLIRPPDLGALAAYGITEVPVLTVRIGLIPTGSELVPHGEFPAPGQVVESNTVMAEAMLGTLGAFCTRYPMVKDDPVQIRKALERAVAENDLVIISAGSSAGTKDFTADVIADLGEVLVHGVAIKPGKPAIIGRIDKKPVIGMPGYPLSALTVLREIVTPLVQQFGLPADFIRHDRGYIYRFDLQGYRERRVRSVLAGTCGGPLGALSVITGCRCPDECCPIKRIPENAGRHRRVRGRNTGAGNPDRLTGRGRKGTPFNREPRSPCRLSCGSPLAKERRTPFHARGKYGWDPCPQKERVPCSSDAPPGR